MCGGVETSELKAKLLELLRTDKEFPTPWPGW